MAQVRGTAVQAAIEVALKHGGDEDDVHARVEERLLEFSELSDELDLLLEWVDVALQYVVGQGGRVTIVEEFATLDRGRTVLTASDDVLRARDQISETLERADFPATPGPHCAGCRYRTVCWDAQG